MPDHRSQPRRRGPSLEEAIIEATIEELSQVGYSGMTIESVARRAGAGKMSVYRRWPSRLELVMDAAYRLVGTTLLPPEPSSLRQDLHAAMGAMVTQMDGPMGEALRGMAAESLSRPGAARLADLSRGQGVEQVRLILERARTRGEAVRGNLRLIEEQLPVAILQHHFLTSHGIEVGYLEELIDYVVIPMLTRVDESD